MIVSCGVLCFSILLSWSNPSPLSSWSGLQANQMSRVLHSSSSSLSSQMSPFGHSPHHLTRNCILLPCHCSSTILSMKNSCWLSIFMGSGGCRAQVGKRLLSFLWNGFTSDKWKTGNSLNWFGSANITVECHSLVAIMGYGPSRHSINLAAHGLSPDLYTHHLFVVDSMTLCQILNGKDI